MVNKWAVETVERLRAKVGEKTDAEIEAWEKQLATLSRSPGDIYAEINKTIENTIQQAAGDPVQLSWLPTDTARASIFSPISDRDLDKRHDAIVFASSWGTLTVHGPPLNTTDEGVLLALLHAIMKERSPVVKVNYRALCKVLGLTYQTHNRRRIRAAIQKLALTSLLFELKGGVWSVERILKSAKGAVDYSTVEIDVWFFSKFLANEITTLDLDFRQSLKGDITKSLYRFLSSHRGYQSYRVETLVMALNMNPTQEMKFHTRALKRAFSELRKKKFCTYRFKDNVFENIKLL